MAFLLSMYPWTYSAKYSHNGTWEERFEKKELLSPSEEEQLSDADREIVMQKRNSFPELPLVSFTTQYAIACFEGAKAFPQIDNTLKVFRLDENAKRMHRSMEGLMMPPIPHSIFMSGVLETVARNHAAGFAPKYDAEWEADDFAHARAVYIRPFSYSEGGIGLNLCLFPWFIVSCTTVGSYFEHMEESNAITSEKVRATRGGTGWIKCASNYVIPILEKKLFEKEGYMEVIFLDAEEQRYVEEGSSCNIFFYLKNGTLVTPALGDRILPGIIRASVIQLARDMNISVEERKISIDEAMNDAQEVFVTGTAAGVSHIASITHKGKRAVFSSGKIGDLTHNLQRTIKGIQYGVLEDRHNWMFPVPTK